VSLHVVPITITAARAHVERHHSHHYAPVGGLLACAVADGERVCCVAILSRPVARMLDARGGVAEVTRLASDGTRHAASMCLAAITRAALALGWRRVVSYTILGEAGTSYRASGWRVTAVCSGGTWHTRDGRTVAQPGVKVRWESGPDALPEDAAALAEMLAAVGVVEVPARPELLPIFAHIGKVTS
jgi:hypothetical protein